MVYKKSIRLALATMLVATVMAKQAMAIDVTAGMSPTGPDPCQPYSKNKISKSALMF